jgi:hypothetical protein
MMSHNMAEKLKKGYEGTNVPDDVYIPPVGIEDIDRAIFELFNVRLAFETKVNSQTTRVPVIFASGERFALTRRDNPLRDKNNVLILPLISIKRGSIGHKTQADVFGTAISIRQPSDYYIKKKLDKSDRDYQKLVNNLSLKNQLNVATKDHFENMSAPLQGVITGSVASRREGSPTSYIDKPKFNPLSNRLPNNIYEFITVPYPKFVGITYNVIFWTQYMQEMNQIIETMMMKFDGQSPEFQITTTKGYKFTAFVQNTFSSEDNFTDFTSDERIIKTSFDIKVPGYILAPEHPGLPSPFRRFVSAPQINFEIWEQNAQLVEERDPITSDQILDRFALTDVEVLNEQGRQVQNRGQEKERVIVNVKNPFSGKNQTEYLKVTDRNPKAGETILTAQKIRKIDTLD